jgi:hypothetical protein
MTVQMYDADELTSAREALEALMAALPGPMVLLGGWAVYHIVNGSYTRELGIPYLGSRDIDVGFHVDPAWTDDDLRSSPLAGAIEVARSMGYGPMGSFRYCRFIQKMTGMALTEEESKRVPSYDLFYLYLDIMVDRVHPRQAEVLGPRALDEPVLARVYDEDLAQAVQIGGTKVPVPPPHLLLAMKLRSLPNRQKEGKVLKDACDVYALLWHSPEGIENVLRSVRTEYPKECRSGLEAITEEVAARAAHHLGIDVETYLGVVRRLGP